MSRPDMIDREKYATAPRMQLTVGEGLWGRILLYLDDHGATDESALTARFGNGESDEARLSDALYLLVSESYIRYTSNCYCLTEQGEAALREWRV